MGKPVYLMSDGELKRKDNTIIIEGTEGKRYIPVETTDELLIFGEVTLNKRFLEFATSSQLILHFFNHYGYYSGSYYPREHLNSGAVILAQAGHYLDRQSRIDLARCFVTGGLENMEKVIGYYARRRDDADLKEEVSKLKDIRDALPAVDEVAALMALEGNGRERYYHMLDRLIEDQNFTIGTRSRRPPGNRTNALISFLNSMCYVLVLSQIYRTHLDPRIGFLHETNFRRFSLNLDLAEIFKPILVDRLILSLINRKAIQVKHFSKMAEGVYLNDTGREIVLKAWEERLQATIDHPRLRRKVSYRRLVRLEAYKVEKHILNDDVYQPFVSGW